MNTVKEIRIFRKLLKEKADPKHAKGTKAYLKSPWKFYGVDTPTKRKMIKAWYKNNPQVTVGEVEELAEKLWNSQWHEEKTLAVMLLQHINKKLTLKQMPLIEKMINEATGWDHLDEISCHLVSELINTDKKTLKYLVKWAKSKNFWVRRTAILAQILQFRRGEGDFELFKKLVIPMFQEGKNWDKRERFFIRKAIGWALRELAPAKPKLVANFVKKHKQKMSGITFREATRKLPKPMQKELKTHEKN